MGMINIFFFFNVAYIDKIKMIQKRPKEGQTTEG